MSQPATSTWLKNPLGIYTGTDADAAGGIVIEGAVVRELVPAGGAPTAPVDSVFDASRHVLIPGLINTHHHFYQTLTRAWRPVVSAELFPWLKGLYGVWAGITPRDLELATTVALAELLLSGCTTAADHHYLFPNGLEEGIDVQVGVVKKLGMRATLTRGSMSLGEDDGGLPPQQTVQDADTILADSERLIGAYHERGDGAFVQIGLAPCSPFSVTTGVMRDTAALAERLDVRLHTHLAETLDEEDFCREMFGLRTVDYLESVGWLSDRTWLAHGIHFDDTEIARLGAAGTAVSHCATSNMRLASGIARALELEEAGAPVGLGVDGSASNDSSNLMEGVRHALMINRLSHGAEAVSWRDCLRWASEGSARCLGRDDIGAIRVGLEADLALYTLDELRFSGAHHPIAALVHCGAH
ncbi:MAG TPA: 8-oxoguanine deaminase, partial [Microbacterium sp.]|nr:8-oxoguanine deaminase [Microbacterium sp.]